MRRHDEMRSQFDKSWKRTTRLTTFGMVVVVLANLAIMAVIVWAIIRLVDHFT